MYYITRKELNKKTRMLYYQMIKRKIIESDSFSNLAKEEHKRNISLCIVKACGFDTLQEYSYQTRYIKTIKSMTPIEDLSYLELMNIEKKTTSYLSETFPIGRIKGFKARQLFKEEIKNRIRRLKYPINRKNEDWKKDFILSLDSFSNYNQEEPASILDADIENFVRNTINWISVGYLFDLDLFICRFSEKHPNIDVGYISELKNTFDFEPIVKGLKNSTVEELNTLKEEMAEYQRVDFYTILNKDTGNLYNHEFFYFIELFKETFYYEKEWVVSKENKENFIYKFVEEYLKYDKI